MLIFKETFKQDASDGIPTHWVVQYYDTEEAPFPQAEYFVTEEEAVSFEKEIKEGQ